MNDSKTLTVSEFLSARLDEAGAKLRLIADQQDRPHWPGCMYPGDMPGYCDCDLTEWLLADIAAKRRMTERAWLSVQYVPPEMRTALDTASSYHAHWVLLELASVYSDHEDYRQEWKP